MTSPARELQRRLRAEGQAWELCKGFDGAAAIGEWVGVEKLRDVNTLRFRLDVNGAAVQEGCSADMLFKVDELIAYISRWFTLKTGDILYTGTPQGTGPVNVGDHITGWLEERKVLDFNVR